VSMDDLGDTAQLVQRVGIQFPVLYSSGNSDVPLAYSGLMDSGANAFSGTYVIGTDRAIHYEFVGSDHTDRAPASEIIDALRQLDPA
jgi:peroxiredoxin